MDEKKLNLFLIFTIIISLLIFLFCTLFFKAPILDLLSPDSSLLEQVVLVSGNLKDFSLENNNLFFKICNLSSCIDVVYFNPSKTNVDLLQNAFSFKKEIKITGKYTLYQNKPEIILYKFED